jgi:hypothetical protein
MFARFSAKIEHFPQAPEAKERGQKATVLGGKLEIMIFQEVIHQDDEFAHKRVS